MANAINTCCCSGGEAHLVLNTYAKRCIMPVDRTRALNPQGRQKSCAECAKSKRKCGLEQPHCLRCIRRRVACIYPPQPRAQNTVSHASKPDSDAVLDNGLPYVDISEEESINLNFDFDMSAVATASTVDFLDFEFPDRTSCTNLPPTLSRQLLDVENRLALQTSFAQSKQWISLTPLTPFEKAKVEYTVELMRLVPRTTVEQNCTPWMHPMLYEDHMPRSMADAYGACALYLAKNHINAERITRHIQRHAKDLMNATIPDSPLELLARTHATMLYQIMLIFGGDFRLYTQAEALIPYLENMGRLLIPIIAEEDEPVGPLPLFPATAAHSAWKSYIFRESAQRTLLSAMKMIVLCKFLRGSRTSCLEIGTLGTCIRLSKHLWNATNAVDFAMSWNTKNHLVVRDLDFSCILENAQPDDLDIFADMLLIAMRGVEDVRGWYLTRGGSLSVSQS